MPRSSDALASTADVWTVTVAYRVDEEIPLGSTTLTRVLWVPSASPPIETGAVVKFGSEFPNRRGSGLKRAKRALAYAFKLAESTRRITRLYIFNWFGVSSTARFDAGLMDSHGNPRPSYAVVRGYLTSK